MSTTLLRAALAAALVLFCIACGGAASFEDDFNNADVVGTGDGACEVGDDEVLYVCPTGMTFVAGSNPPCIVHVTEPDPEVTGPCQPDEPSYDGRLCTGFEPPCTSVWDVPTCSWICGGAPDGRTAPLFLEHVTTALLKQACP